MGKSDSQKIVAFKGANFKNENMLVGLNYTV
jgi:hypothetical protein